MKIREIEGFWKDHRLALGSDEGFRFGPVDVEIAGLLVCWKPTLDAMRAAHEAGCNLIVTHEELNFPPVYGGARMEEQLTGGVTLRRIRQLIEWNLTVFRGHTSLDRLCILDALADLLGLSEPVIHGDYWERTYNIPPVPLRDLALEVRKRLGMGPLRVVGDLDRIVQCVALPWGGVAISANPNCVQTLLGFGPDVLITGETEEIPMYAARDAGVCLIETGHSESESPGLRRAATMLADCYPGLRVEFYQNPRPWAALEYSALPREMRPGGE